MLRTKTLLRAEWQNTDKKLKRANNERLISDLIIMENGTEPLVTPKSVKSLNVMKSFIF